MSPLGLEGGRCKQQYKCAGCDATQRGTDLPRHYKNATNFELLKEMKLCQGDEVLEELKDKADTHTLYMFKWGHTKDKLPSWKNHVMIKRVGNSEDEEESGGGTGSVEDGAGSGQVKKQTKIAHFFQVIDRNGLAAAEL
jgi:hypothetical protein